MLSRRVTESTGISNWQAPKSHLLFLQPWAWSFLKTNEGEDGICTEFSGMRYTIKKLGICIKRESHQKGPPRSPVCQTLKINKAGARAEVQW